MTLKEDWIKRKMLGNGCVELIYVKTDKRGAYVIKETIDSDGMTVKRIKDIILDFPIELLEMKRIKRFNSPYGEYDGLMYRINIDGKEFRSSVKQIHLLIQKKVVNQPFYSKYGFGFKDYIKIVLRSQEKKLERKI